MITIQQMLLFPLIQIAFSSLLLAEISKADILIPTAFQEEKNEHKATEIISIGMGDIGKVTMISQQPPDSILLLEGDDVFTLKCVIHSEKREIFVLWLLHRNSQEISRLGVEAQRNGTIGNQKIWVSEWRLQAQKNHIGNYTCEVSDRRSFGKKEGKDPIYLDKRLKSEGVLFGTELRKHLGSVSIKNQQLDKNLQNEKVVSNLYKVLINYGHKDRPRVRQPKYLFETDHMNLTCYYSESLPKQYLQFSVKERNSNNWNILSEVDRREIASSKSSFGGESATIVQYMKLDRKLFKARMACVAIAPGLNMVPVRNSSSYVIDWPYITDTEDPEFNCEDSNNEKYVISVPYFADTLHLRCNTSGLYFKITNSDKLYTFHASLFNKAEIERATDGFFANHDYLYLLFREIINSTQLKGSRILLIGEASQNSQQMSLSVNVTLFSTPITIRIELKRQELSYDEKLKYLINRLENVERLVSVTGLQAGNTFLQNAQVSKYFTFWNANRQVQRDGDNGNWFSVHGKEGFLLKNGRSSFTIRIVSAYRYTPNWAIGITKLGTENGQTCISQYANRWIYEASGKVYSHLNIHGEFVKNQLEGDTVTILLDSFTLTVNFFLNNVFQTSLPLGPGVTTNDFSNLIPGVCNVNDRQIFEFV